MGSGVSDGVDEELVGHLSVELGRGQQCRSRDIDTMSPTQMFSSSGMSQDS